MSTNGREDVETIGVVPRIPLTHEEGKQGEASELRGGMCGKRQTPYLPRRVMARQALACSSTRQYKAVACQLDSI